MIRLVIAALTCVLFAGTENLFAKDYVLRLELQTAVESKSGNGGIGKSSDSHTIEVLIAPERRFQGKTTWDHAALFLKGKATESKAGGVEFEIECRHSSPEGNMSARSTVVIAPGESVIVGGMASSITSEDAASIRETKRNAEFRLTLVEDDSEGELVE